MCCQKVDQLTVQPSQGVSLSSACCMGVASYGPSMQPSEPGGVPRAWQQKSDVEREDSK